LGREVALLGLVRLEEEDRRGADDVVLAGVPAVGVRDADGLGEHAGLERHARRGRMVAVVRVAQGVRQHDRGLHAPVEVDEARDGLARLDERVVAEVEELDLGTESGCRGLGLVAADGLDLIERPALEPLARGFAALAVGQAGHHGAVAAEGRGGDRAARSPDEVPGVGADDEERVGGDCHGASESHPWRNGQQIVYNRGDHIPLDVGIADT
jgi:hypothetical protein